MDKKEYIMGTLSRTNKKDRENYVINAIWHKINNEEIKPVSQQYVKREQGYALIDLYFPQINYGVEVEEDYHDGEEVKKADELRFDEIATALKSYKCKRIKTGKGVTYTELTKEIEETANEIVALWESKGSPAWETASPVEIAKRKKQLTVRDGLEFDTIAQIYELFKGRKVNSFQRCSFEITEGVYAWCPKVGNGGKWFNEVLDGGDTIIEYNVAGEEYKEIYYGDRKRVTFAKAKSVTGRQSYKFIGVYEFMGRGKKERNGKLTEYSLFKRVSEEIKV